MVSAAVFVLGAAMLNRLTLELAPAGAGGGAGLQLYEAGDAVVAPGAGAGAGDCARRRRGSRCVASLDVRIVVLSAAVLLWVGGFDVLYACQDFEHDRAAGLYSVPQAFGLEAAFWIARAMHLGMLCLLLWLTRLFALGPLAMAALRLWRRCCCMSTASSRRATCGG